MTEGIPSQRLLPIALLAWLTMIGLDFLLHGGILARFYSGTDPFLLPLTDAFRRIPLGYLSFFLLAVLLVWLMRRLAVRGWREGLIFGLKLGALVWGAFVLGLYSISTADGELLAAWFVGQTAELSAAGMFVGSALAGTRLRKLFLIAAALVFACAVITVLLQNLGLAPAAWVG